MTDVSDFPVISVFGSHAPVAGSPDYELAREVGRRLAEAGFAVATGGYEGTMAGTSQGAAEAGGIAIGVTSSQVEKSRSTKLNPWVIEEIRYHSLGDRLMHLVTRNEGMIVLPGGIGTISEFTLAWSFLQTDEIEPCPLILLGDLWAKTVKTFVQPSYVAAKHVQLLSFVSSPEEAVAILENQRA